jgi:hypothetical protein
LITLDHDDPAVPAPVANAPTPPSAITIEDVFSSSLIFDDEENPWQA